MLWACFSHCQCSQVLYELQVFAWIPAWIMSFLRFFTLAFLLSQDYAGSHRGSIWSCKLAEGWKKRESKQTHLMCVYTYTCIHPWVCVYTVCMGASTSICQNRGRERRKEGRRKRDVNIISNNIISNPMLFVKAGISLFGRLSLAMPAL